MSLRRTLVAIAVAVALSAPAMAFAGNGPVDQGKMSVGFGVYTTLSFNNQYVVVSGSVGYFLIRGLEAALQGSYWIGPPPAIGEVSPRLTYYLWMVPVIHPYVGPFYRHLFIGQNNPDVDSIGGRAGIVFVGGGRVLVGLGAAYERIVSACTKDCTSIYPEISFSITFGRTTLGLTPSPASTRRGPRDTELRRQGKRMVDPWVSRASSARCASAAWPSGNC